MILNCAARTLGCLAGTSSDPSLPASFSQPSNAYEICMYSGQHQKAQIHIFKQKRSLQWPPSVTQCSSLHILLTDFLLSCLVCENPLLEFCKVKCVSQRGNKREGAQTDKYPQRKGNLCLHKNLHTNVQSSITRNSLEVQTT